MFYRETGLTVEQINSLLAEISGSSVIKSLDLIDKNLFQASVDLMVAAFTALESLPLPNKNLALVKIKDGMNPSQSVGAWYRENSPATVGGRTRFQSPIIKTWVEKGFFVLLLTWVSSSSKASGRHTWTNI